MSRKQDVMNLFNFMIDLLKEGENLEQKSEPKQLLVEQTTPLIGIINSPDEVLSLMKRVDEITKNESVTKTVTGLREKLSEAKHILREGQVEKLQEEKLQEEKEEFLSSLPKEVLS